MRWKLFEVMSETEKLRRLLGNLSPVLQGLVARYMGHAIGGGATWRF